MGYFTFCLLILVANICLAQDTLSIEPGSQYIKGHILKPHRVEFEELIYRDTDSVVVRNQFYIQLTHGMKFGRPVYYMMYMGISNTNSGWDIIRFDRETLEIQNRSLQIGDQVAVLNFMQDSIYGNYPLRNDTFNMKVENYKGFDFNINPYVYASIDLKQGMVFKWPAVAIKSIALREFTSEVIGKKQVVSRSGKSYDAFEVVFRRDWNGKRLAVHHYVSQSYPYYLGRDWYIEPDNGEPYLWHQWIFKESERLEINAEGIIKMWLGNGVRD